jgi:hypothetical protein
MGVTALALVAEAILAVLITTHAPVAVILIVTLAPITSITTTTTTVVVSPALLMAVVTLCTAGLDIVNLLLTILLLAHDLKCLALVIWLGIFLKELLRRLVVVELNKDTALEGLVVMATQTHSVGGAELSEESFNVELCAGGLFTETFGVDAAWHSTVFEDLDRIGIGPVVKLSRERIFAAHAFVVFAQLKEGRFAHGVDNGLEWLEVAHTLEGVQDGKLDRVVLAATNFTQQELVTGKV